MNKFKKLKIPELLELCKDKNIVVKSRYKKTDLINKLIEHSKHETVVESASEKTEYYMNLFNDAIVDVIESASEETVVTEAVVEEVVEAVVEAPVEAVVEAPVEAVVEAPVEAVVEAPVEAVVEAVVEAPVEAVVEAVVESLDFSSISNKLDELVGIVTSLTERIQKMEEGCTENIIDIESPIEKSDDNFDILKNKNNVNETEGIDILNALHKIGIRFKDIIDVNCYDNNVLNYIKNIKGYTCNGTSLINTIEDCTITDIELSDYKDNNYDMVLCLNLFEYLTDKNIQLYYKNLLRISNSYIIIKINLDETAEKTEYYMNLFNDVVNKQDSFMVERYVTPNLPINLFILRKEAIID
jgi:hypothetical protein